jgi:hypothetical protein
MLISAAAFPFQFGWPAAHSRHTAHLVLQLPLEDEDVPRSSSCMSVGWRRVKVGGLIESNLFEAHSAAYGGGMPLLSCWRPLSVWRRLSLVQPVL